MCGIAGFWQRGQPLGADSAATARRMIGAIAHRGPDDSGVWLQEAAGLALAHARLAIIDVSPAGRQPMVSASGRFVIIFNGEIYNHADLRHLLEPRAWRGYSDTEVLLAGFDAWGVEATLRRTVGMFAVALWDTRERTLTLARDRLGEKPLYYGWQKGVLLFGSELKALRAHPSFANDIDRDSVALFLRYCYVPAPFSIFRAIRKVEPGTIVTVRETDEPRVAIYWSLAKAVARAKADPFRGSAREAVDLLEQAIGDAVRLQRVADVPLGAFLSGGIDSSTVVSIMQAQSPAPVKTFTVGFHDQAFDEAPHARAIAAHLGTDHTELYVTAQETLDVIPRLPELYDEPFADSSQVPTFLICQLARRKVTVSLSGDGGDELFGGYNRYAWSRRIWSKVRWLPAPLRHATGHSLASVPPALWNRVQAGVGPFLPTRLRVAQLGDRVHKLAERMREVNDLDSLYHSLVSEWPRPAEVVIGAREPRTLLDDRSAWPRNLSAEERMMYLDAATYLPDDILAKLDRAAMGVSLETRVPFLDHRVVELAWRLPQTLKISRGVGKWILRQVLHRHVPAELVERPKMGFGIPLASWLRGPLRGWAEELLEPGRLAREGYLHPQPVQAIWQAHLSGHRQTHTRLWNVLMFQAWLERQSGSGAGR